MENDNSWHLKCTCYFRQFKTNLAAIDVKKTVKDISNNWSMFFSQLLKYTYDVSLLLKQ